MIRQTTGALCFIGMLVCISAGSVISPVWAQDAKPAAGQGASQRQVNVLTIERRPFVMMQNGKQ